MTTLRNIWLIAWREIRSFFVQPLAWVILTALLILNGVNFSVVLQFFNERSEPFVSLVAMLFSSFLFWLGLLFGIPLIAMRLLAEERQSGTLETLLTAPVTENQVAVGKFLGGWAFLAALWSPFLLYVVILDRFDEVDWLTIASGTLGFLLTGGFLLAAAMFVSAFTRHQIVAAVVGFAVVISFYVTPLLFESLAASDAARAIVDHANLLAASVEFSSGVISTPRVIYPVSGMAMFVFLTARALESLKGR